MLLTLLLLGRCLVLWTAAILILSNSRTNINTHHYVLGMTIQTTTSKLMIQQQQQQHKKVYRYFGFGSNVLPSTMKALRQIEVRPDSVTAAILPGYELKFHSDAAFVRRHVENNTGDGSDSSSVVHGVLYTLTDEEFAQVGHHSVELLSSSLNQISESTNNDVNIIIRIAVITNLIFTKNNNRFIEIRTPFAH